MNLFRGIFSKRAAGSKGRRQGRGPFVVPAAPAKDASAQAGSTPRLDITIDESILALSRELSGLAQVQVPPAAKERGWASLQRELERSPVRAAGKVASAPAGAAKGTARPTGPDRPTDPARSTHSRTWRWALGSAAAAVAVIATLLGTYGGGLLQTAVNDDTSSTITSVVSSDTTEPVTTVTTNGTTVSTNSPDTTGTQPDTTLGPAGTDTTDGGTSTTGTTQPHPTTTQPHPTTGPTTTQPISPTTTGEQQNTASQREGSAEAAVRYLADLVITGNTSGARALVAPEAQSLLVQMIWSLNEPYGYQWPTVLSVSGDTVRLTLDINDRVVNGQGELVDTIKHFVIKVRVDSKGAVVTAISAGS